MIDQLDHGRIQKILDYAYGSQGWVMTSHGDIVVRDATPAGREDGTWHYLGTIGEAETMKRLQELAP